MLSFQVAESMAQPTLMRQASQEQWAEWGPMVRSGRWLGCYMQTELAHGSNLSALRTTATLDMDTDEWVINTPEPSAGKVWIGGSGLTATYGVVMANLIIKGKSYGMHPFLVHLRSLKDHTLLPGRRIMEMGCKLGAPAMDNGYTCFDSVRIPRDNLLQRFQTVSKEGVYEKRNAAAQVMTRGTMTLVRVGLCEIAAHHLARGATIAIRYAVVRRQGTSSTKSDQLEPKILDYASVQTRVLTALASAYAITFVSQHLRGMYNEMIAEIEQKGNSALLPIVHGYSSVLKAVCTNESLAGIERCRRSMGGHGFSQASGFDFERNQPNAGLIYEGENSMLLAGPSSNFLIKQLNETRKRNGKASRPELAYLELIANTSSAGSDISKRAQGISASQIEQPAALLDLLGYRAALLVERLDKHRSSPQNADGVFKHIDTNLAVRASTAHGAYLLGFAFHQVVQRLQIDSSSATQKRFGVAVDQSYVTALDNLLRFYLLQNCILSQETLSDFLELNLLTGSQLQNLRESAARLLSGPIRRDAIGLVESFDMDDWYLCSPLGSSDGRAYERMIEWMKREPLNHTGERGARDANGVVKGYHDGIGKLIRGEAVQFTERVSKL